MDMDMDMGTDMVMEGVMAIMKKIKNHHKTFSYQIKL